MLKVEFYVNLPNQIHVWYRTTLNLIKKTVFWALATALKVGMAHITVFWWSTCFNTCFSVFLVINNSYLDIQHDYINSKSKNKNGLDAKLKSGCGPNSGPYDAWIASKHVLTCFSPSKTPMWTPNTTMLIQN